MAHLSLMATERIADLRTLYGWKKERDGLFIKMMKQGPSIAVRQQIEELSRGQRKNPVWRELQKGVVMPYDVKGIVKGLLKLEVIDGQYNGVVGESGLVEDSLISYLILDRNLEMTPALQWEIDHEDEALSDYWSKTWAQRDVPAELVRPGIILSSRHTLVGASPHAIVYGKHETDPKAICAVILKCIHPLEATHPIKVEQAVCRKCKDGKLRLKKTHKWYFEAQATMGVLDVDHCDLVIYTSNGIIVKQVRRNTVFVQRLEDRVDHYIGGFLSGYLWYYYDSDSSESGSESDSD